MLSAGLVTLAALKTRLLPEARQDRDQWDADLARIGRAVASLISAYLGRPVDRVAPGAICYTGGNSQYILPRNPVERVTSAQLNPGFATERDITGDILNADPASGIVTFSQRIGTPRDQVRIAYTGGWWLDPNDPDTPEAEREAMPAGAAPVPDAVLEAFFEQAQHVAQATGTLRTKTLRKTEADEAATALASLDLIPFVRILLDPHARLAH